MERFEVRSSRFSERRTQNFELRIVLGAPLSPPTADLSEPLRTSRTHPENPFLPCSAHPEAECLTPVDSGGLVNLLSE